MKLGKLDHQILSELMKNSKTSDRELARRLGVSQPTVTRRRARLEKEGIIKEYTFIPDFTKLGYHIMALTLFRYPEGVDKENILKARKRALEIVKESPSEMIMAERGLGLGYDGVTISFHKDYGSFVEYRNWTRQMHPVIAADVESFLVNLDDEVQYRPLTFSTLAKHLLKQRRKKAAS